MFKGRLVNVYLFFCSAGVVSSQSTIRVIAHYPRRDGGKPRIICRLGEEHQHMLRSQVQISWVHRWNVLRYLEELQTRQGDDEAGNYGR